MSTPAQPAAHHSRALATASPPADISSSEMTTCSLGSTTDVPSATRVLISGLFSWAAILASEVAASRINSSHAEAEASTHGNGASLAAAAWSSAAVVTLGTIGSACELPYTAPRSSAARLAQGSTRA
eukprot:scaffold4079_cov129-Isochrysis_galbana.AAC.5